MTSLPIDYRRRPWKAKYIDTECLATNRWCILGEYQDGTVSITDGTDDIMEHVPKDVAQNIVDARNTFVDTLMKHIGYARND